jgi:hypothetical protein
MDKDVRVMTNGSAATQRDLDHLWLLSIFHYVLCGITALFSCLPIIHLIIGVAIVSGEFETSTPDSQYLGWGFIIFAVFFILVGWLFAINLFFAARFLTQRKHYTYCLVIAAVSCIFMPFGTILGVFTLVTLTKESVKRLFEPPRR